MNFCGLLPGAICTTSPSPAKAPSMARAALVGLAKKAQAKQLRELGETTDDPTQRVFGTTEAALRPCLFERSTPSEFCWKA